MKELIRNNYLIKNFIEFFNKYIIDLIINIIKLNLNVRELNLNIINLDLK